jgi:hypothetical protein
MLFSPGLPVWMVMSFQRLSGISLCVVGCTCANVCVVYVSLPLTITERNVSVVSLHESIWSEAAILILQCSCTLGIAIRKLLSHNYYNNYNVYSEHLDICLLVEIAKAPIGIYNHTVSKHLFGVSIVFSI